MQEHHIDVYVRNESYSTPCLINCLEMSTSQYVCLSDESKQILIDLSEVIKTKRSTNTLFQGYLPVV